MVLSLDNKIPQFPSSPSPTAVRDQLNYHERRMLHFKRRSVVRQSRDTFKVYFKK